MIEETNQILKRIGVKVPKIVLPKDSVDMSKWAVVACDQFTSEPEYWKKVEELVGDEPSTVKIVLPEVYLESPDKQSRIAKINQNIKEYLDKGILEEKFEGMVLMERAVTRTAHTRKGLILALDLEKYEYTKGSKTLIRATEGTVESRIPPRLEIRKNALVELPHIMVLIDDPNKTVIEPLFDEGLGQAKPLLYDFELMMGGGHIRGWKISDEKIIENIANSLENLISEDGFLFAMGDGNHSLATAKTHWNNIKERAATEGRPYEETMEDPARFALVELVNVHDEGLEFEPIHRVVFNVEVEDLENFLIGSEGRLPGSTVQMISNGQGKLINLGENSLNLLVGNLQKRLDEYMVIHPEVKIDYVHGEEAVRKLAIGKNVGFILPGMKKEDLFPTVEKDGALPRKTFSMGEAQEKRYYVEARKIVV